MSKLIKKAVIFFFIIFLIYYFSQNILDYKKKFNFYENYKKDYQDELEKNKKLKSEILKNQDYYTIEKNIRQKLNLLRPNEIAIILPQTTPTPSPAPKIEKPVCQQWIELFF
jgi:cell division protein FtsB